MKKIIIHTLLVKANAKLQFQIKLPSNVKGVEAIKITHPFISEQTHPNYPINSDQEIGWLWLRVPDNRDVFFADILRPTSFYAFEGLNTHSLSTKQQWEFNGTKNDFQTINVPTEHTLISGFYWNKQIAKSITAGSNYNVKIYLKLY